MSSPKESVTSWLTNSGLFLNDETNENFGGIHAFYDEKKHSYGFLYPEITGYFLSSLAFLHYSKHDTNLIELGKASAKWLVGIKNKFGGIIQGISTNETKSNLVYSFDTGICVKGLLDYYSISKHKQFFDFGKELLEWISSNALEEDGTIKPYQNLTNQKFESDQSVWYKQKGCLHIKLAIPFIQMYKLSNDDSYLKKAELISNTINRYQKSDGSIAIHENSSTVHMHTLCYALEGLLHTYDVTKSQNYLTNCINALDWCTKQILDDGSTHLWFNVKYQQAKTSYHVAQLIRLMILVDSINNDSKYSSPISKLESFLLTLQSSNSEKECKGGFYEEYYKSTFGWKKRMRLNSWGSMFALQALYWIENKDNLEFSRAINYLY